MTVLESIQRSAEFLEKKGVDSPRLQAELLLAHLLRLPRMQLYLNFERTLGAEEIETFREFIKRRGRREPLQHIIGSVCFCGLEICVTPNVLVPRPETELLAERAWLFLNQRLPSRPQDGLQERTPLPGPLPFQRREGEDWQPMDVAYPAASSASLIAESSTVLDFGTGSGCLAVALAVKSPTSQILAVDASPEALEVARRNAVQHGVAERITFLRSESLAALPSAARFSLIVSNPPYIPTGEIDSLEPEVRDFEPRAALDGGADGLDFYRCLSAQAGGFLRMGGKIMLEFGDGQAPKISALFGEQKWIVEEIVEDYTRRPRILIARR